MADKPPTLPPQAKPFPGARTPGWNDPPTLQYSPGATGGRTRLNLNKRVPFPLQGTVGDAQIPTTKPTAIVQPNQTSLASAQPPPLSLPPTIGGAAGATQPIAVVHPMPNMNAPPTVTRLPPAPVMEAAAAPARLPQDAQDFACRVLREQVASVQESMNVRRDEIERRLGIIEQLWRTENLSAAVQDNVFRLAKAIAERSFNAAMELYTALVANHSNECATWAVAVRHLVLSLQPCAVAEPPTAAPHEPTSSVGSIPAMFVPAMPRQVPQTTATTAGGGTRNAGGSPTACSSVQHI